MKNLWKEYYNLPFEVSLSNKGFILHDARYLGIADLNPEITSETAKVIVGLLNKKMQINYIEKFKIVGTCIIREETNQIVMDFSHFLYSGSAGLASSDRSHLRSLMQYIVDILNRGNQAIYNPIHLKI